MVQLGTDHAEFNVPLQHVLDNFFGIGNLQRDGDVRMLLLEIAHQFGEKIFSRDGACAQGEFPSDPLRKFTQRIESPLCEKTESSRHIDGGPLRLLSGGPPACPVEEPKGKRLFEGKNMTADRRLGQARDHRLP